MADNYKVPVSAKGIVFEDGAVWLRKNERGEWELPGGKVDVGEQPIQTLARELREELGFEVEVIRPVHAWVYTIKRSLDETGGVLVLSYLCNLLAKTGEFETYGEGGAFAEFKKFQIKELAELNMPQFYKDAVRLAWGPVSTPMAT